MKLTRSGILCLLSLVLAAVALLGDRAQSTEEIAIPVSATETTTATAT